MESRFNIYSMYFGYLATVSLKWS